MNEEWVERCMQLAHDWAVASYLKALGNRFEDLEYIQKKLRAELRKAVTPTEDKQ
jgi:hypothetical protein